MDLLATFVICATLALNIIIVALLADCCRTVSGRVQTEVHAYLQAMQSMHEITQRAVEGQRQMFEALRQQIGVADLLPGVGRPE